MNTKTTWRFRIETNEYRSVIEGGRSNLFRYAKRGDNTGKSKLKLRKTSLTNVRNTSCWTWQEKDFLKIEVKRLLALERARVETDNFYTFSLVEKAHVTINVLNSRASLGTSGNKMADKHPPRQVAFRSFDHAVIFRRRPQSRRRIEPNVKEENDAWKYHFKWRNSREKLEGKVKTWMVDVAIQCLTKI